MEQYGWTQDGIKVFVEDILSQDKYLVRSVLEVPYYHGEGECDYEEALGELRIVDKVYDKAPTELISQEVVALRDTIDGLKDTLSELRKIYHAEMTEHDKRKAKYAAIPELKQLDDFIAGKITHYVQIEKYSPPTIISFQDTKSSYSGSDYGLKQMKMLALYGKATGDLEWRINEYNDGSGSWYTVVPCTSLEQAKDVLQQEYDRRFSEQVSEKLMDAAIKNGATVPEGYAEKVKQDKVKNAEHEVKRARESLLKAEQALAAL